MAPVLAMHAASQVAPLGLYFRRTARLAIDLTDKYYMNPSAADRSQVIGNCS